MTSSTKTTPQAEVTMRIEGGEERIAEASGDGMVDACYKAIYKLAGVQPALERYSVKAITGGTDALGEVSCLVREDGMTVAGQGAHSDIVMASALALVNALNRLQGARTVGGAAPGRRGIAGAAFRRRLIALAAARILGDYAFAASRSGGLPRQSRWAKC